MQLLTILYAITNNKPPKLYAITNNKLPKFAVIGKKKYAICYNKKYKYLIISDLTFFALACACVRAIKSIEFD
jgi:hypothetical protein